jgi:hypothetical protein
MTTTPYSDQWREHTRERMKRLGYDCSGIVEATGLPLAAVLESLYAANRSASLEVVGPIDDLLGRRDEQREARALRGSLVPVHVNLDALTNLGACHPLDEQTHTITLDSEQLRAGRVAPG